jgi:formiminotetrahydrofolate cyclodeaminase
MGFSEMTIDGFLNQLASETPTPGGGSAAALSGAMASGLLCMVANLTIGKERFQKYEQEVKGLLDESSRLKDRFLTLADQDAEAFNGVIKAMKMPKCTSEQRQKRTAEIQDALKSAAQKPLEVAEGCAQALVLAWRLHDKGNPNALSDIGVAAHMAYAGMEGAIMNVQINLAMIKDAEYAEWLTERIGNIRLEGNRIYRNIIANVSFGK